METALLQVTIGGMPGAGNQGPVTLLGELDFASGALLIDSRRTEVPGADVSRDTPDTVFATNLESITEFDAVFLEKHYREAVAAYFEMSTGSLLELDDAVKGMSPQGKVEPDGLDDKKMRYRVAPDIANGHMAVLAMCWLAKRQIDANTQCDVLGGVDDMLEAFTVGLPPEMGYRRVTAGIGASGIPGMGGLKWD